MADDADVTELQPPTYTERELLIELADQAFVVAHYLLQASRGRSDEDHARALISFIITEVQQVLGEESPLPNICPVCFTNLDSIEIAATSDAHRDHLNDDEIAALNDAYAKSWSFD